MLVLNQKSKNVTIHINKYIKSDKYYLTKKQEPEEKHPLCLTRPQLPCKNFEYKAAEKKGEHDADKKGPHIAYKVIIEQQQIANYAVWLSYRTQVLDTLAGKRSFCFHL